ncbi:hypothetical protein Cgig2_020027 [Carnegiea gigantea]|uniref:Uncharacterized protein n=1 Tax=Carnegiea gigantea TaxID=171969 RepID=A0A9Q1K334_9CARY|nr:hypothetical protein Cgig2_020027 [Carnegiea gigantea]
MPKTTGEKGSWCPKWVADAQPSTGPTPPKCWSSCIATSVVERPCHQRLKTTVTISDNTTSFGNRFAQTPFSSASPVSLPIVLGFFEKLAKHNCMRLLNLGDSVYPRLVRLFYANLEVKATPNGIFLKSIVKNVQITPGRSVLESIFGLQFINTAPSNLACKCAKALCLSQFACPQKIVGYKR